MEAITTGMTIEEYSTLMGYEKTCEMAEYETANLAYMMAGNMNKDEFCEDYRKHKDSVIIATLAEAVRTREIAYHGKEDKERRTTHMLLREAHMLLREAHMLLREAHMLLREAHMLLREAHMLLREAHTLLREANKIRRGGMDASANALDKIAASLIGRKDCIKWKLRTGFALSETDNEYIADNLQ